MSGGLDPRIEWQRKVSLDQELTPLARHVALVIASSLDYWLRGKVARSYLMLATGHGCRQVSYALALLQELGWLEVERSRARGRATMYRAVNPSLLRRSEVRSTAPHGEQVEVRATAPQTPLEVRATAPQIPLEVRPTAPVLSTRDGKEEQNYVRHESRADQPLTAAVPTAHPEPALTDRSEGAVDEVLEQLRTTWLKPRTPGETRRLQGLIRQRLTAGVTPTEILEDAETVTIEPFSAPGLFATTVRRTHLNHQTVKRPDWCGECDETTRMLEGERLDRFGEMHTTLGRCPTCHPLSFAVAMNA